MNQKNPTTSAREDAALRERLLAAQAAAPPSRSADPGQPHPELKAAWDEYHAALDDVRRMLENTVMFEDPRNRAKMYHQLMEIQAMAYNFTIASRLEVPRIGNNSFFMTNIYTMGSLAPEIVYGIMLLDSRQTYVLSGRRGDAVMCLFQGTNKLHALGDDSAVTGSYDLNDMAVAADGRYEIVVGGPERPGNWIPLDPACPYHSFTIRRLYRDPGYDDLGEIRIRMVSKVDRAHYDFDEFDELAMAERIRRAAQFVRFYVQDMPIGLYDFTMTRTEGKTNAMALIPGLTLSAGSPVSRYALGRWTIADDEAVLVEFAQSPKSAYWSLMLGDSWSRSLPFNYWQSSLNNGQARVDGDGGTRLLIAKRDPGIANWLDTTGHNDGAIIFRNYAAEMATVPELTLVKLADLPTLLPHAARVTPEERQAAIDRRREGYIRIYGE